MGSAFAKGFNSADETRKFKAHGHLDLLKFGEGNEACVLIDVTGVKNYAKAG